MKRRLPWKRIIVAVAQVAVILVVHAVLIHSLAETDIVATILSAGPHAPTGHLLAAGGFVLVRLLAVLLLPGIILSHLVLIALDRWTRAGADPGAAENGAQPQEEDSRDGNASQENL